MSATKNEYGHYLRDLLLTIGIGGILCVACVLLVDPYGLHRLLTVPGFNVVKPSLNRYHDEIKLTHAQRLAPRTVIVGNSRAEIGFDPASQFLRPYGPAVYNLAVPGSALDTAAEQVAYLYRSGGGPANLVVGAEFLDFVDVKARPAAGTIAEKARQHTVESLYWRFDLLFSLASLKDVLRTIHVQYQDEGSVMADNGYNPLREYLAHARNSGYRALFDQKARSYMRTVKDKSRGTLQPERFDTFRRMLERAAARKATVKVVIYPYHAQMLEMFEQGGLSPRFDAWKAGLVRETAAVQARYPDADIAVFDFSGFGPYNCEPIPAAGDRRTATRWYWEGGHFKKELGDLVLGRIAPSGKTAAPVPADGFGFPLRAETLAGNARRIAAERERCRQSNPTLFADVAALAATYK